MSDIQFPSDPIINSGAADTGVAPAIDPNQTDRSKEADLGVEVTNELWSSRRRMAWVSLWAIILPTILILFKVHEAEMMGKISDLMSWYYLALASIVGSYFGFKAWATIKGR
jgi:hypothetical protein